jgi:hypothetical protein
MANVEKNITAALTKNNAATDNKLELLDKRISALIDKLEKLALQAPANENEDNQNDDTKEKDLCLMPTAMSTSEKHKSSIHV